MVGELLLFTAMFTGQNHVPQLESAPTSDSPSVLSQPPDRWIMMKYLQGSYPGWFLDRNRMQVYGWVDSSFTASTATGEQLPMGFNYRANEMLVQQNWLRVEQNVVRDGTCDPTFGFRSDSNLGGSDYRFTLPRGIFNGQLTANDGGPNTYGIDPVQFYAEAYYPTIGRGLDVKAGRMYCQYGVEAIDSPSNPLTSHSYTFIYNPFTQTGVIGTLQTTPAWSFQLGLVMGPDVFFDSAASPYAMFSAKWAPTDGRNSVLISAMLGNGRYDVEEQFNNPNLLDLVYTHTINSRTTYTLESLIGYQTNVPNIGTAWWYGIVNYLTYQLSSRLSSTSRLEVFDDESGNRTGFPGYYTAFTTGLNFKPRPPVIVRTEVRYDYNNESRPFADQHGLFTATADVILRW